MRSKQLICTAGHQIPETFRTNQRIDKPVDSEPEMSANKRRYRLVNAKSLGVMVAHVVQGYLTHKKLQPPP